MARQKSKASAPETNTLRAFSAMRSIGPFPKNGAKVRAADRHRGLLSLAFGLPFYGRAHRPTATHLQSGFLWNLIRDQRQCRFQHPYIGPRLMGILT